MTKMSVQRYDLPLTSPFRIAYDTVTHARNLLVTAHRDGRVGYGEAAPIASITGEDQAHAAQGLSAWVQNGGPGEDGVTPGDQLGMAGGLAAKTALLDLAAREDEDPLCTFLTGAQPRPVATSITIPLMSPEEAAGRAARHRDAGFSIFKIKAGTTVEEDMRRIERVREAVGDCEVRVDANQGWSRQDAKEALPRLLDQGVDVLEQPLRKEDLDGHAALRGQGVPIMLDESVFSPDDARRALEVGACDRINIKLQKTGGLYEALEIAELAAGAGVECMLGCMIESRVGILAGAHVVAAHDNIRWADLDGYTFLRDDPVLGGAKIDGGMIALGPGAGLGIDSATGGEMLVGLPA